MFVPVLNQARAIGLLSVQSYMPKLYDHRSLRTLQTLAEYCGGALERIRAREELRQSEERYKQLAECSPTGIFECDARLLRLRQRALVGNFRPEPGGEPQAGLALCDLPGGTPGRAGKLAPRRGGRPRLGRPAPRIDARWRGALGARARGRRLVPRGEPGGYVGTVKGITAIKQSEEGLRGSREQLRALAAHLQIRARRRAQAHHA